MKSSIIVISAITVVALMALPTWAQDFNDNRGNNVAGVDYIDPANVTASASSDQGGSQNAAASSDRSNMDGDYLVASTQGNGRGQWHSNGVGVPMTIRWTFDQNYQLKDMWLWNSNQPGHASDGRGIRDVEVWTDGGNGFTQLTDSYVFTAGPYSNPYRHDMDENGDVCPGCNEVNLGGASLIAVELRMTKPPGESNYGAGCCNVIEEVRFNIGEGELLAPSLDFTWNVDSFGKWSTANTWNPWDGPPGDPGGKSHANHMAIFGSKITSNTTIITETAVSARAIIFDNSNTYTIAGSGSVNLVAATAAGLATEIQVIQGTHQFQAVVNLQTDTTVDVATSSAIIFNNALDLNSSVLTKTGGGEIAIRNDFLTSGGELNCNEGTCSGSGTISGDLNNNGGIVSPGNSSQPTGVPEPATLLLVMIGAIGVIALRDTFRQRCCLQ